MGKGRIEKNFLDDGFKVTYYDGVIERFHKNLLDDNYKGDKGSSIIGHWLDDGFTVNKYDGTKEQFYWRSDPKEFLGGDKGTRVREGFWGDYFVSENPYSDYKPLTIADARKAKYQETPIRFYGIDRNDDTTLEVLKSDIESIIEAAGLQIHTADVTVNGHSAVALVHNYNSTYMPVYSYFTSDSGTFGLMTAVQGRGYQTNASDLGKLFYKSVSPWGKIKIKASIGSSMATHFGYSVRAGGAFGGIAAITGMAIGGGIRLAAKGVKALLRDNDAYQKEMDFYNQAAGVIDYAIGYNDSYDLNKDIRSRAESGLPLAQYQMGVAYIYGIGVDANEEAAFEWFDRAAERGELQSQNIVAGEYLYNKDKTYSIEQKRQAIGYLYNLASFGNEWAWELLIDIYGRGSVDGIDIDYDEAVRIAEILTEDRNLYAAVFLAPIYDSQVDANNSDMLKYKNDSKAFEQYQVIADLDSGDNGMQAALRLAEMCREGRGTERNDSDTARYLEIASTRGSMEAKAALLDAYTFGKGVERSKSKVKSLSKELLRSNDAYLVSMANYCLFSFAQIEERYADCLKYANAYLNGSYTDPDKSEHLERFISDIEEKISGMTDEERRLFLKEPKKASDLLKGFKGIGIKDKKKALVVSGIAAALVVIIAVVVYLSNGSIGNTKAGKGMGNTSGTAADALKSYSLFLSQDSFIRNDKEEVDDFLQTWHSENCIFDIAYINDDDIPELIVLDYTDADHTMGWGQIYTYSSEEDVVPYYGLSDPEGAEEYGMVPGYYKGTGWIVDFNMLQGYGGPFIENVLDENADLLSIEYEPDENDEPHLVNYSVGMDYVGEDEFYRKLDEVTGGAELVPYDFKENTQENRDACFGVIEDNDTEEQQNSDNDSEGDIVGGIAFNYVDKTFEQIENEYGTLSQQASWGGAIYYTTPDEKYVGFQAGWNEDGDIPRDERCISFIGKVSDIFNVSDDISLQELADLLGEQLNEDELYYDDTSDMGNGVIWYVYHNDTEYKAIVNYDENIDIISATLSQTDR